MYAWCLCGALESLGGSLTDLTGLPPHVDACCSPHVAFVGYSMPHPSEELVNVRIQTTGKHMAHHTGMLLAVA